MAFPSSIYAPPSVYTKTTFDSPLTGSISGVKLPVLIGTGNEILSQLDLELIRGSSATVDQQVVNEDLSGRKVLNELDSGEVSLGSYAQQSVGELQLQLSGSSSSTASVPFQVQVKHYPIVTGDGTGTTTTKPRDVSVTLNGEPVVVMAIDGTKGLLTISETPIAGDSLKVTYFFNRTDTLITDDVSSQITEDGALIYLAKAGDYKITTDESDQLLLNVDGTDLEITLSPSNGTITPAALVTQITAGAGTTSLAAATYTNNEGGTSVVLSADHEIVIGAGTANSSLGIGAGNASGRNKSFYVFNGPIVDGSNGGVTTTDVADVTVKVDGVQVIPASVDGHSRMITLEVPPASGSTVTVQYYFNTWQDTFDYLAHTGITEITATGFSAGKKDFVQGVDFILKDDKIFWGTGALVSSDTHTTGYAAFGESQVSTVLKDNKGYLEPCSAVVDTSVSPAVSSKTKFTLPYTPTTGNGRGTPIGISLFQTVSNGRIDLPTNRPDLVKAYWGFSVQDALDRGAVDVLSVDHSTGVITLKSPVPTGASVWATQYYNVIQDTSYSVSSVSAGVSGVGTYSVLDKNGNTMIIPSYAGKSAGLATVTIEFPSGSELLSDVRYESPYNTKNFVGAVEEDITVTFADKPNTPAAHTLSSTGELMFIDSNSDTIEFTVDGNPTSLTLSGAASQSFAYVTGSELAYPVSNAQEMVVDSTNKSLILTVDGIEMDVTLTEGTRTVSQLATTINTVAANNPPVLTGTTKFISSYTVTTGENDTFDINVDGVVYPCTVAQSDYATATLLAGAIQTAIDGANAAVGAAGTSCKIDVTANFSGQIVFTIDLGSGPVAEENMKFVAGGSDLLVHLGIDESTVRFGDGAGAKAEVISHSAMPSVGGNYYYDRFVLKNRIKPETHLGEAIAGISVDVTTAQDILGFEMAQYGVATSKPTVKPATMYAETGLTGNQETANGGHISITMYASGGTEDANGVFNVTIDGKAYEVVFTQADGAGTALTTAGHNVPLSNGADGIVEQINTEVGSTVAFVEGAGIRITSTSQGTESAIKIGDGNANGDLGFGTNNASSRTGVTIPELVSTVTEQVSGAHFITLDDSAGTEHFYMQSQSLGTGSNVSISDGTVIRYGSGFIDSLGDGGVGEAGKSGFTVTSSISTGSGSIDNSQLSATGAGQDGIIGQTYRDLVTGLTFTILPRATGVNYPTGTLEFTASAVATTDANLPISVIHGVDLIVANTEDTNAGDTALVETFQRGGEQPEVGDAYYCSYKYSKQDFNTRLFSKFSTVEALFGELDPTNPLTLAAFLAMSNGAIIVGLKQVVKDSTLVNGEFTEASVASYRDAVDGLSGSLLGGANPDLLVSLRADSLDLYKYMARHANIQSSIRYKSERTIIAGSAAGTKRKAVMEMAKAIEDTRFRLLYPDMAYITITDAFGNDNQHLVGGEYLAAAWAGVVVSPTKDVATPWTNSRFFGFDGLARNNDAVQKNQIASSGVTVLEDIPNAIKIRHGLTTDMADIVKKTPTVIQIADEVQQLARKNLESFIGIKFLPSITSQIEGKLSMILKDLVRKQIIAGYTGVAASVDADDPTVANVEAYYQPVFPLLYLVVTFNLRSQL